MYLLAKEDFSEMAKEIKSTVEKFGPELKHTQILDALAFGLTGSDFKTLSKTSIPYSGVKSGKLYVDPEIRNILKLEIK